MQRFFGKANRDATPRASTSDAQPPPSREFHAADKLSDTIEILDKREKHLLRLVDQEIEAARTYSNARPPRKREALECMKRKRIHENELAQIGTQKVNLMQNESTLRALKLTSVVVEASQAASAAIEREVKKMNGVEGIESMTDRLEDNLADASDIMSAVSKPIGEAANLDDDELLDELEALDEEMSTMELTEALTTTTTATTPRAEATPRAEPMPYAAPVPRTEPAIPAAARRATAARQEQEERELAALRSSMSVEDSMPMPMLAARSVMAIEQPMHMPMMAACY